MMSATPLVLDRRAARWLLPGLTLVAGYLIWTAQDGVGGARGLAALLLVIAFCGAAAISALVVRRRLVETTLQPAWDYWSIGLALWALAAALRLLAWISSRSLPPVPSVADLLRFAGYLSAATALASYPAAPGERFGRLRRTLDVAILWLSVLALSWMVFVRPSFQISVAPQVTLLWTASNPVFDLLLAALAIRLLLHRSGRGQAALFWSIAGAAAVLFATDLTSGYAALFGEAGPGSAVDAGWMVASLVLVAVSFRQAWLASNPGDPLPIGELRRLARLEPLLAVAFTYAVIGFVALDWRLVGRPDWVGVGAAAVLVLLLVARQGAIGGQVEMRQYAAAVNAALDLVFICAPDGRLRLANPALRRVLGPAMGGSAAREADVLPRRGDPLGGLRLQDFLLADRPAEELLRLAVAEDWAGEASIRRGDGSFLPVSLSLTAVQDERRTQPLLLGTAHDLTVIKQREVDLRLALNEVAAARSELESLNAELEHKVQVRTRELADTVADLARLNEDLKALDRLKSEFVALVSHELRAPLTNIRSGVELILTGDDDLGAASHQTLELVQSETGRLSRFVETILDLSALEAGKFPIQAAGQDLAEIAGLVRRRLPEAMAQRVELDLPGDLPEVLADERGLTSVLFHLLDNAHKYAPSGPIRISAVAGADNVQISVSDQGPGIPPEQRERVFEMFHRLDTSDAREVYGHGLGLHLVRRLLEAMGGGIRAGTAPGGGAQLTFWLPLASQAPQ